MANYTKTTLIDDIATDLGLAKTTTKEMVDAIFDKIAAQADAGVTVAIPGFGKFEMRERAARMGRNPATGQPIEIAASRSLAFKAFKGKS